MTSYKITYTPQDKGVSTAQNSFARDVKRYGYSPSDTSIPEEYKVKITSVNDRADYDVEITALLQKEISIKTGGQWDSFRGSLTGFWGETAAQWILGKTSIMPILSRRMWKGSSPLAMDLNLKFEAVHNAVNEVLLPCVLLQNMSLPGGSLSEVGSAEISKGRQVGRPSLDTLFLSPPGPSPFPGALGDMITVCIGKLLAFKGVIISDASSTFSSKFTSEGTPISAEMNLRFESFQIMSKEDYSKAFNIIQVVSDEHFKETIDGRFDETIHGLLKQNPTIQKGFSYF